MPIDPRTPVLVGAGQVLQRAATVDEAREPAALMADAVRAAAADAGLSGVPTPDSVRVVGLLSWRYHDPARVVADLLGIHPAETALTSMGGNSPQMLVNATAAEIQRGDIDLAVLTGGEAWRTRMKARKSGADVQWTHVPEGTQPSRVIGTELNMTHPAEKARGIVMPVQIYPMFETALRAAAGRGVAEHQAYIAGLWSRFSAVAADNPYAWLRKRLSAEEIATAGPDNRMIGFPYPKYMNSNNDVDMAAALIMCSAAKAEALGVPRDRWVFPVSGADCHDHLFVSNRAGFAETPAIRVGGRDALALAGLGIDDIEIVDLYSCFPSAVQLGAAALGLGTDRQLTRTGGLAFAGGPWNNYVMHAIATVVNDLRERPSEHALVWANGGYATKHAFGVYATEPPAAGFRHAHPQAEIDALPSRLLAEPGEAVGPAVIEGYTVMHDRDGTPETVFASTLLTDGRRAWGTSTDGDLAAAVCLGEWVGREVRLDADGTLVV